MARSRENRFSVQPEGAGLSPGKRATVLGVAVVCGAAVMELELLGARVIGPMFGVSLFVWTALITVTLLALAVGYYLGGRVADARASMKLMGLLVGAAGSFVLLMPLLRQPVLRGSAGLGVRAGALAAAFILFGPALTLLGTVTPLAVKLFLRSTAEAGRTVGRLSALSTLGSFAGTVATGFWLVPHFHVDQLAAGTAILLFAAAGLLLAGRARALAVVAAFVAIVLLVPPKLTSVMLPSGTKANLVRRDGSFYGQIEVVDYTYPPRHTRELLVDGIVQGGIDVITGQSIYAFGYFQELAGLTARPDASKALVIGLGAGVVPNFLAARGLRGTAVEIDPTMARIAQEDFGYDPDGPFHLELQDGRSFLRSSKTTYDLAFLDVFTAENEPAHLLTKEAFEEVAERLGRGGALIINFSGMTPGPGVPNAGVDTLFRTLNAVFPSVRAYYNPTVPAGQVINFTLVAQKEGAPKTAALEGFGPVHPMSAKELEGFLQTDYRPTAKSARIYTDGWCPVESDSAQVKLLWRRAAMAFTPREILLN